MNTFEVNQSARNVLKYLVQFNRKIWQQLRHRRIQDEWWAIILDCIRIYSRVLIKLISTKVEQKSYGKCATLREDSPDICSFRLDRVCFLFGLMTMWEMSELFFVWVSSNICAYVISRWTHQTIENDVRKEHIYDVLVRRLALITRMRPAEAIDK